MEEAQHKKAGGLPWGWIHKSCTWDKVLIGLSRTWDAAVQCHFFFFVDLLLFILLIFDFNAKLAIFRLGPPAEKMESVWDHCGVILESFWDHFGIILRWFWDRFGMMLESFWDPLGIIFEITFSSLWNHSGSRKRFANREPRETIPNEIRCEYPPMLINKRL